MTDWLYDPHLDRLDIAIRAIWHLATKGMWTILEEELELSRAALEPVIDGLRQTTDKLRSERQVFALLRACPLVLDAAMELVRRYEALTGTGRIEFYQRLEALGWLS